MRGTAWLLVVATLSCGRTAPFGEVGPEVVRPPPVIPNTTHESRPIIDGGTDDAGQPLVPCDDNDPCPHGFTCQSGLCVLNGASGGLQVTLTWRHSPRQPEDLDLHVVEPTASGTCEIWYGDPNSSWPFSGCGAVGSLDLDSNPACIDTVLPQGLGEDTENVIYPADRAPPSGHYVVRVDYYENCDDAGVVPFTVSVRRGNQTSNFEGSFDPGPGDQGAEGSGRTMFEFDMP